MSDRLAKKLDRTRRHLADLGIQAFLIPQSDPFQGSPISDHEKRIEWLTGFDGSAGLAVVTTSRLALFVDPRYREQATHQTDSDRLQILDLSADSVAEWLASDPAGDPVECVGYDPVLHTVRAIADFGRRFRRSQLELRRVSNPIDLAWKDQPERRRGSIFTLADDIAGESSLSKRQRIANRMQQDDIAWLVVAKPECIAWILNVRGDFVPCNPIPHGFGLLKADGTFSLFADCVSVPFTEHCDGVTVQELVHTEAAIRGLDGRVQYDGRTTSSIVLDWLESSTAEPVEKDDPVVAAMAVKNSTEINGFVEAHHRDGMAMVKLLHWISTGGDGNLSEMQIAGKAEHFRHMSGKLHGMSFQTIAASGHNAAIIHYHVTPANNRLLQPGDLVLVDSGGQYLDGTTDITRTVAIYNPPDRLKAVYTHVLKGLIMLSSAKWPADEPASRLDAIARYHLWRAGLDYAHGTGHGVGHYLNVHEGTGNISARSADPLKPGMVVTIEPGAYRTDDYGIRLENMVVVREASFPTEDESGMLQFETLSLAPFDRQLVEPSLLTGVERDWINGYHLGVLEKLESGLDGPARQWLRDSCIPL